MLKRISKIKKPYNSCIVFFNFYSSFLVEKTIERRGAVDVACFDKPSVRLKAPSERTSNEGLTLEKTPYSKILKRGSAEKFKTYP